MRLKDKKTYEVISELFGNRRIELFYVKVMEWGHLHRRGVCLIEYVDGGVKIGTSMCSIDDEFNANFGIIKAFYRLNKSKIYDFDIAFNTMRVEYLFKDSGTFSYYMKENCIDPNLQSKYIKAIGKLMPKA